MNVVIVGPFAWAPKGTVSARAFFIGRALAQRGHQVTILIPPYDNPSHAGFEAVRDGVRLVNMRLPSWGDSWQSRFVVPLGMARSVVQLNPHLVHVFKPTGYAGLTGMYLRSFVPRLPLVLDSDDWEGRGGWADIKAYPRLWHWFIAWQEGQLARRADVITVASRALQTRMWGLGVEPERVIYLPNGPSEIYKARRRVTPEAQGKLRQVLGVGDAPLALYMGHISYGSEVNLIVEALPIVLKTAPNLRVVIMGVGDGVLQLQESAKRAGVADNLVFTGWVDHEVTPVYLATADLALYPHRDTLVNRAKSPSKITAYMAMGKPIVASAVGEVVEYLDGGECGLLVEPGQVDAFANAVVVLLQNPELRQELGQRAEQRIWEHYDWICQVERVEAAYHAARGSVHATFP